jgi:hypothetical protein
MTDNAAFEPMRKSSGDISVLARANDPSAEAQASLSRPTGELLHRITRW